MSYDANRACDQCGNPSVWATTCEGCEMWAKGHRDGLKEGETDRDAWKANAAEWRERAENAEREIHERRGSDGRNLAAVVEAKSRATKVESQLQTIVDSFTFGCRSEKGGGQSALEIIARDRDEWKERANKFEATVEMLEARGEADLLNAEAAIARATQAEAQAAAMREVLVLVRSTREAPGLKAVFVPKNENATGNDVMAAGPCAACGWIRCEDSVKVTHRETRWRLCLPCARRIGKAAEGKR